MSDATTVHAHRVFDLNVASCLALPAAAGWRAGGGAEIVITQGEVPARLPEVVDDGLRRQIAPGRVLLQVDGVARYLVEEGRCITLAREPGADDDDLRTFLLGPAFGALLQQRGELVLRASVVGRDGAAVVLLGPGGAGKSSLAWALSRRGWAVLADDLGVVRADATGALVAVPGWTELKAWPSAFVPAEEWPRVRRGVEKRRRPIAAGASALPITRVCVLGPAAEADAGRVSGPRKLELINRQAYRPEFLVTPGRRVEQQQLATRLAREVPLTLLPAAGPREDFAAWGERCAAGFSA